MTAVTAPFRALRYRADRIGQLGAVWAPPYDVITRDSAEELRAKHSHNIVRITNPEGDGDDRYSRAAETLQSWVADGSLAREDESSLYLHRHSYQLGDDRHTRTGVWALLKLEPFDAGIVLPHERTMSGPKVDRLALMRACQAQLSPVFFICSDPNGKVSKLLGRLASEEPSDAAEFPKGHDHQVWQVARRETVEELTGLLNEQVYLIADGHHRYETALAYRDGLLASGAPETGRGAHEFIMAYVVPEGDPGLALLPAHRVVTGEPLEWIGAVLKASGRFDVKRLGEAELDSVERMLEDEAGRPAFVLVARDVEGGWLLRLRKADSLSGISSVAFHEVFMPEAAGLTRDDQLGRMGYVKSVGEALERVRSGSAQAAALLAAPQVEQVREAARAGERLPTKTTYFWPKVPTGVAVHWIDPGEEVR